METSFHPVLCLHLHLLNHFLAELLQEFLQALFLQRLRLLEHWAPQRRHHPLLPVRSL